MRLELRGGVFLFPWSSRAWLGYWLVPIAMVNEEVGSKLVRLLYFVGAGVICTKGINLWREYEQKAALKAAKASVQEPSEMVNAVAQKS